MPGPLTNTTKITPKQRPENLLEILILHMSNRIPKIYVLANRVFCSHDNVMAALCTQIFERTNKYVCSTLHSLQQYIQYKKSLKVFVLCQNEKKLVFVRNPESLYQKLQYFYFIILHLLS